VFDYPAKSGVRRSLKIEDAEVVRAVRGCCAATGVLNDYWCAAPYLAG